MVYRSLFHLSGFLMDGYWRQSGSNPIKWNLSDSGPSAQHGVLTYNLGSNWFDGSGISNGRKTLVRDAFEYLSNVTGINFVETSSFSNVDIAFGDKPDGAYSQMWDSNGDGFLERTIVNVSNNWSGGSNREDDYVIQTILHEIGHALGLGHMGIYNGSATYPRDAKFTNDSWQNSIMSYFSQAENTKVSADFAFLQTFMAADLLALNRMYGPQSFAGNQFGTKAAFLGNTTYGFNSTISESDDPILSRMWKYGDTNAYTIVDGGGIDTLDFSGWSSNQFINLAMTQPKAIKPTTMNIAGGKGNVALAFGTLIENAVGGSGHDHIRGNSVNNSLSGGAGNDLLLGFGGNDQLFGGAGSDKFHLESGNDLMDGGSGADWLALANSVKATKVNLSNTSPQNSGFGMDTYLNIENVAGGAHRDVIDGSNLNNALFGNSGNDLLLGQGGNDLLNGGNGNDQLYGSTGNDTLYGEAHVDRLFGGDGDDKLFGGSQNDLLVGANGNDQLHGGSGHDQLVAGNDADNLVGGNGNDIMYAGSGDDLLNAGAGSDKLVGGLGADEMYAGIDVDRDLIVISDVSHSGVGGDRDVIYQFDSGEDDIHLRDIDSNTSLIGDQNFYLSKTGAANHAIWLQVSANGTLLSGDVDGDAVSDFELMFIGVSNLTGYDLIM